MRRRISIRGYVLRSVGPSVCPSVGPSVPRYFWRWEVCILGASCAVYPALFLKSTPFFQFNLGVLVLKPSWAIIVLNFPNLKLGAWVCLWTLNLKTRLDTRHKMRLVCVLFTFENNTGRTYGQIDGQTDRPTDWRMDTTSYRAAMVHLKSSYSDVHCTGNNGNLGKEHNFDQVLEMRHRGV